MIEYIICAFLSSKFSIFYSGEKLISRKKSSTTPDYPISALLSLKWYKIYKYILYKMYKFLFGKYQIFFFAKSTFLRNNILNILKKERHIQCILSVVKYYVIKEF